MSRIGELLVREKVLSLQQLQQAQDEAKRTGKRLGATLAKMGMVPDNVLTQMVARQYSLPAINLSEIEIDPNVLKLIPKDICEKHQVIPVRRQGDG
jgi:type IV pilus assembly protein PilB